MKMLMKFGQLALILVLVLSLTLGLCTNGLTVFAVEAFEDGSRMDTILKEIFGDDITTEEAFDKLMEETQTMNNYQNQSFCYVPDGDSFYLAFGDETAAITTRQVSTYVDQLAGALGVSYKNLAKAQMVIQDVHGQIADNKSLVEKADLISLGFSNYGATYYMCKYMAGQSDRVTESQWIDLVGEENMPLVEDLLEMMFKEMRNNEISEFGGYDLEGGLECYAYAFLSNAIHQAEVIESIREINKDAVIMLVGTYNDLENVKLDVNGQEVDMGELMNNLVNASNLLAVKNADAYRRVIYVDAPDVNTTLDANASKYTTPKQYVFAIVGRQGLPTDDGHAYIVKQIKDAMVSTCPHAWWDDGVVITEPTCDMEGEILYTCTWCGETTTSGVEKIDHTWDDGVVTKKPTATEDGVMTYTCTCCGEKKTEVIEKTGETDVLFGDVNGDNRINSRDARTLLLFIAGMSDASQINEAAADMNGDGRINSRDARAILNYIAGVN